MKAVTEQNVINNDCNLSYYGFFFENLIRYLEMRNSMNCRCYYLILFASRLRVRLAYELGGYL